jgi:hypothetical protein
MGMIFPQHKAKAAEPVRLVQTIEIKTEAPPAPEPIPEPPKPVIKPVKYACNCQKYASYITGKYLGGARAAKYVQVNSQTPSIGAIVIFTSGRYGHAAVVVGIEGDQLILLEANNSPCKVTEGRRVDMNRGDIKGYVI